MTSYDYVTEKGFIANTRIGFISKIIIQSIYVYKQNMNNVFDCAIQDRLPILYTQKIK